MTAVLRSPWLPFRGAEDGVRLYCLPHAGGSASVFRPWIGRVGPVAVCPVQLPGRETRAGEEPFTGMAPLVAGLVEAILTDGSGPYAVYGHSLGALVGFELVREIARRGGPDPVHLLVSGSPAPHLLTPDSPRVSDRTDAQIAVLLRELGGTPELFLSDPSALRMILRPFRADFAVREGYEYQPGGPLTVPITALVATDDPRARVSETRAWREHTIGRFQAPSVEGGHFAVLEQAGTTRALIERAVRG